MAGLFLALIVIAAFGLLFWMLEGEDWSRMRHGHLPRPSMGHLAPWMRDFVPWIKDGGAAPSSEPAAKPEPLRQEASAEARSPAPPAATHEPPRPAQPDERSVEASVYDRLYGGRRSVQREDRDD